MDTSDYIHYVITSAYYMESVMKALVIFML